MKKKRSKLKPLSAKKAKIKKQYKQVCLEIDANMIEEAGAVFCTSCHTTQGSIGHSHNLSKGNFPQYEVEKWNIHPRCQDFGTHKGCHNALDRGDFEKIAKFIDLEVVMDGRMYHEPGEYNKFVTGLRAVGCFDYDYVEFDKK